MMVGGCKFDSGSELGGSVEGVGTALGLGLGTRPRSMVVPGTVAKLIGEGGGGGVVTGRGEVEVGSAIPTLTGAGSATSADSEERGSSPCLEAQKFRLSNNKYNEVSNSSEYLPNSNSFDIQCQVCTADRGIAFRYTQSLGQGYAQTSFALLRSSVCHGV